jgi:hypothetical protein
MDYVDALGIATRGSVREGGEILITVRLTPDDDARLAPYSKILPLLAMYLVKDICSYIFGQLFARTLTLSSH